MDLKHRVWVSDLGYQKGSYKFVHGINSPDMQNLPARHKPGQRR